MMFSLVEQIHEIISYIGIAVILWGVVRSILGVVAESFSKKKTLYFREPRLVLCEHIVFGLEFMVAGDVISTIIMPDYHTLLVLGGLVLIRTILSYFVDIELRQLRKL